jgi:hypothetical protein
MDLWVSDVDTAEIVVADDSLASIDRDHGCAARRWSDQTCRLQKSCTHRGGRDVSEDLAHNDRGA